MNATLGLPQLPALVKRKLYKTGQTRGASLSEIYQNRVGRNSTVIIPFSHYRQCLEGIDYENGAIVLVRPETVFEDKSSFAASGLTLGSDALVFYSSREEWEAWSPATHGLVPARARLVPLGGEYVARVPGTTRSGGGPIREGFTSTTLRGAGIRVYEYAATNTIVDTRLQLEALLWRCGDARDVMSEAGMSRSDIETRAGLTEQTASERGLLDDVVLREARVTDGAGKTVCPLCLKEMSAQAFSARVRQAEGRERIDNYITEASLFHIAELRVGDLGHRPYNLGWGHHHCNVVAKDVGIPATLAWMEQVVARNSGPG